MPAGGLRRRRRIVGGSAPAAVIQGGGTAPEVCVDLGPLLSPGWDQTFGDPKLCIHKGRVYGQGTLVTDASLDGIGEIVPVGGLPPQFRPAAPVSASLWNDSVNSDDADENSFWPATVNPDGSFTVEAGGGFGNLPRGETDAAMHLNMCVYDLSPQPDNPPFESLGPYLAGGDYSNVDALVGADGRVHFAGRVQAQNDHASQIVPFPLLPTKYVPEKFVAGKVFDSNGQAWTAQAFGSGGGAVQLAKGSARPHTFHLITFSGYNYTHTGYEPLLDNSFGKNQRLIVPLPVANANLSFSPPRNDWAEIGFGVEIAPSAVEGEGAGVILGYNGSNYYAVVAVVKASRTWRWEVYRVVAGTATFMAPSASYPIDATFGDQARQVADVWVNSFGTQLEYRERNPSFSHILTDPSGFDSLGQMGLVDLVANNGGVTVVPEIRAQSIYIHDTPSLNTVVTLDTLGWDAKEQNVPAVTPGSFSATVGAGGIRRE